MNMRPFVYLIVFHQTDSSDYGSPIVWVEKGRNPYNCSTHLAFDSDMEEILPLIQYILQLPRGTVDLLEIDEETLSHCNIISHKIIIIPDTLKDSDPQFWNAIIENTDGIFICDSVSSFLIDTKLLLGIHRSNELTNNLLKEQWKCAKSELDNTLDLIDYDPILIDDTHISCLPLLFLARQLKEEQEILKDIFQSDFNNITHLCYKYLFYLIVKQQSIISLEKEYSSVHSIENTEKTDEMFHYVHDHLDDHMNIIASKTRAVNTVISFTTISKRLKKLLGISSVIPLPEAKAVRLMGLHRAITENAHYIEINSQADKMYQILDEMEQQLKQPTGTNNPHVWRMLREIGKQLSLLLTEEQLSVLKRSKSICAFSEYPLGLAILPNEEVPLCISHNVYNVPIIPLSRQITIELSGPEFIALYRRCSILFIECVPNDESNRYVRGLSEQLASQIKHMAKSVKNASYQYEEAQSTIELKRVLNKYPKGSIDILVLSAHGFYDTESNSSGLCIGEHDTWMADEDDIRIPPVVILSACHVSPRGRNVINACDLLMRSGASVVLSTLIPISVFRNTLIYSRIFTYLFETIKDSNKYKQYKTLADLWTGILATNAVNEIIVNSPKLQEWYLSENSNGIKRIEDFMLQRAKGRMRTQFIYSDTIAILKEMLKEDGLCHNFDSVLKIEQCFPESFFYQMVGYPQNVLLIDPKSSID
ncbi:MAG: hypothetical protein K6G20_07935 [Ruminococcus sp.]|nr:hypothetical protein [Ruminococcus sp.]